MRSVDCSDEDRWVEHDGFWYSCRPRSVGWRWARRDCCGSWIGGGCEQAPGLSLGGDAENVVAGEG
jgi:hypothetical protein